MQRHGHGGVEAVRGVEGTEHQGGGQSLDDPRVTPLLEGVDDLLSDAGVFQRGRGALETEAYALALVANEGLEGGRLPAPGAGGAPGAGQGLKARPAEQVARAPLAADAVLGVEEVGEGREVRSEGSGS